MSKRLTEEAMAYFDECVSLSTFDSSDFSSQEDPPIKLVGGAAPVGDRASFSQASSSIAANCSPKSGPIDKQVHCCTVPLLFLCSLWQKFSYTYL